MPSLRTWSISGKEPRVYMRMVLGVFVAANLAAALMVFKPWGGSPEDLERHLSELRRQAQTQQRTLERLRALVANVEKGRAQTDEFINTYFLERRNTSPTLLAELDQAAQKAGIKQREASFQDEPVEGSETIRMMTITAHYEGTYADLMNFINHIDRSPRFLIVDSLTAAPQQQGLALNVNMKLHAFVREAQPAQAGTGVTE